MNLARRHLRGPARPACGKRGRAAVACARAAAAALSLAGALAACGPAAPGDGSFDPALGARIDAVFAEYGGGVGPGCSVGVIRDGNLVFAAGYGAASLDHGIANGLAMGFHIPAEGRDPSLGIDTGRAWNLSFERVEL